MKSLTIIQAKQTTKVRESGVELLRILAIFFVVVIHEVPSILDSSNLFVSISRIISWPAIFCFAFITGYFLILKENESKTKRFLWLTGELVFWRVVIALIFLIVITIIGDYSWPAGFFDAFFQQIILTLVDVKSWYFWAIIFIYLIFPFFTHYLNSNYQRGKKLLRSLLIFLLLILIIATIGFALVNALNYNFSLYQDSYTIVVTLAACLMGAYWHLIEQDHKIQVNWKWQLIGVGGLASVYIFNFACLWWWHDQNTALTYLNPLWYLSGWFYFLIFKGFKFSSRFVNWWAGLSWGIYILHNGNFLPRGWAPRIINSFSLNPYLATILIILVCYFLAVCLTVMTRVFDQYIIKLYLFPAIKKLSAKEKTKAKSL